MKKALIIILIILLAWLCYNMAFKGIEIGNIKIESLSSLQSMNEKVDEDIAEIDKKKSVTYSKLISDIKKATNEMVSKKEAYESLAQSTSEQELIAASTTDMFDIEFLWARIGNYASENGVDTKMDVVESSNTSKASDLKFTVSGNYVAISDFVRELEDDAKLSFTIDEFELVPESENSGKSLKATFRVRDIYINPNSLIG